MRVKIGALAIQLGKAPYPRPNDTDTLSRIAQAYGVRRDSFAIRETIRRRLCLPSERNISNAISQILVSVMNNDALNVLAEGKELSEHTRHLIIEAIAYAPSPAGLLDDVLADLRVVLSTRPWEP